MNSLTIELKLNSIELNHVRKERNLYFVLAATSAENPGSLAVTHLPDTGSLTLGKHQTEYDFAPPGDAGGGLFLLSMPMPASQTLYVRVWVMESMDKRKDIGKVLAGVADFVGTTVEKSGIVQVIGGINPLVITGLKTANDGLSKLGGALSQSGDRQVGFVSMDQSFDAVTLPLTCTQVMMSGEGKLSWSWLARPASQPVTEQPQTEPVQQTA
ncbi:hypothetical protein [Spirosoma arcticum]